MDLFIRYAENRTQNFEPSSFGSEFSTPNAPASNFEINAEGVYKCKPGVASTPGKKTKNE